MRTDTPGFDEHHPVAVQERRVVDGVRVVLIEDPGLEAEGGLKPRECSFDVAIGEGWVDVHESLVRSDLYNGPMHSPSRVH